MNPIKKTLLTATLLVANLAFSTPAWADITHYDVRVDGMACPFCAYGLEKKLKELPGATNLNVDLEAGKASFDVDGNLLLPGPVEAAIRDAGFSLNSVKAEASGTVRGTGADLSLDIGGEHMLALRGGAAIERLKKLVQDGKRNVVVVGAITGAPGAYQISVARARVGG